ncbi:unnamed protein product [Medioppia subpectinata]|uniref:Uncharacterized protein n=1 Tax=Medioppia subpectinata TaxID=1979941 RepID=A0A7R9M1G0_9ACAR|nr:unnamed protein product [Medioppia subpectinata]CAG2123577.1 unnamed protein product [Medioppia subpectinata]
MAPIVAQIEPFFPDRQRPAKHRITSTATRVVRAETSCAAIAVQTLSISSAMIRRSTRRTCLRASGCAGSVNNW